jgi:hypothetical protein
MTKQILLTFDYELFLGQNSGSIENCMIKPTDMILDVLVKNKLSSIFFVDTLYLHRLKEVALTNENANKDYNLILCQLRHLIKCGNYVFHHLHPHWLDAKYKVESNQWDVSNKDKFALSNLSPFEIKLVFKYSQDIIREIYEGYTLPKHFGFRAGGLYAQPFHKYKNEMIEQNIKIDFSVLRNAKSEGENRNYCFDYSNCPVEDIYRFSEEVNQKDDKGEFTEVLLSQFQLKGIHKVFNGLYYRQNVNKVTWKRFGDGSSSGNVLKSTKVANKFFTEETYSIELLNNYKAYLYYNDIKKEDFLHLISHPKLCSSANILAFDHFLKMTLKKFKIESDLFKILSV